MRRKIAILVTFIVMMGSTVVFGTNTESWIRRIDINTRNAQKQLLGNSVISVENIELDETNKTLKEGECLFLTASITPIDATNKNISWTSSDTTVVRVKKYGNMGSITAVGVGTATITATTFDGGKVATCHITVEEATNKIPVEGIIVSNTIINLSKGTSFNIAKHFGVYPANATNKNFIWKSSNVEVATVDEYGKLTALEEGTVTITATTIDGNKTATKGITVVNTQEETSSVECIILDKASVTMAEGASVLIITEVFPLEATNKNVTWSSSNNEVVRVKGIENAGSITAVGVGTATITATTMEGEEKAYCEIRVEEADNKIPVEGITFNKPSGIVEKGSSTSLVEAIMITPANATNPYVNWESSNPEVAVIDEDGKLTALAEGTTVITVTTLDGNKTATKTITVVNTQEETIPVEGITFNRPSGIVEKGSSTSLVEAIMITPANATNKNVTWTSSNPEVATVNEQGILTALAEGTTVITVTTVDGNKTATKNITVRESIPYQVDEEKKIISKIKEKTTVEELINYMEGTIFKGEAEIAAGELIGTGYKMKKVDGTEYTLIITGDINGDGKVTTTDLLKIRREIVGLETFDEIQVMAGNVDEEDGINITDLVKMKRYCVGLGEL